jgi:hypothetical protein
MRVRACPFYLSTRKGLIGQRRLQAMFTKRSLRVRLFSATDSAAVRVLCTSLMIARRGIYLGDL